MRNTIPLRRGFYFVWRCNFIIWLGMRDSNPRSRLQRAMPYHLANPQRHQVEKLLTNLLMYHSCVCTQVATSEAQLPLGQSPTTPNKKIGRVQISLDQLYFTTLSRIIFSTSFVISGIFPCGLGTL